MVDFETLLTEVTDGVATIWLNRPESRNALSMTMSRELYEALELFERDDAVRAIVVTGAGNFFSAGADLEDADEVFADSFDERGRYARPIHLLCAGMRTPIIAALNGSAVGAGLTIPLCFDIRFGSAEAKYGLLFSRRGLVPDLATTWSLPRLLGTSKAMELLLSGRLMSGTEAHEIGLISRALPAGDVLPAALEFARDLAANTSPIAVAATKALVNAALQEPSRATAGNTEAIFFRWLSREADATEGMTAFLEKRAPLWPTPKSAEFPADVLSEDHR
jgi:enoyl-CoA hydratase/carnithine racemase